MENGYAADKVSAFSRDVSAGASGFPGAGDVTGEEVSAGCAETDGLLSVAGGAVSVRDVESPDAVWGGEVESVSSLSVGAGARVVVFSDGGDAGGFCAVEMGADVWGAAWDSVGAAAGCVLVWGLPAKSDPMVRWAPRNH